MMSSELYDVIRLSMTSSDYLWGHQCKKCQNDILWIDQLMMEKNCGTKTSVVKPFIIVELWYWYVHIGNIVSNLQLVSNVKLELNWRSYAPKHNLSGWRSWHWSGHWLGPWSLRVQSLVANGTVTGKREIVKMSHVMWSCLDQSDQLMHTWGGTNFSTSCMDG